MDLQDATRSEEKKMATGVTPPVTSLYCDALWYGHY